MRFAILAGMAALTLAMRPVTRTVPAALPGYEATRSWNPAEASVVELDNGRLGDGAASLGMII
jgi:hypothetical protein